MQEWNIYCDWHNFLMEAFGGLKLDAIVYLRASPKTCFDRLHIRQRAEVCTRRRRAARLTRTQEDSVPLPYLESIHQRHEEWLVDKSIKCARQLGKVRPYA